MPKNSIPLNRKFWGWIVFGVLYFLAGPFTYQQKACNPEERFWTIQGDASATQNTINRKKVESRTALNLLAKKAAQPEEHQHYAEWLCEDVKVTDLALVYFTFALVIVGWFTMRSADENTKKAQRAYLVAGPFRGIPKNLSGTEESKWMNERMPTAKMFHGPYRMTVINFGQTAAYSTKVEWGLCPFIAFPFGEKMRTLLDSDKFATWRKDYLGQPDEFENIFGTPNYAHYMRRIEIADRGKYIWCVHFGRVTYKDVFGETHWTTFAYHLTEEGSDAVPPYLSTEHSDYQGERQQ